MCFRCPLARAKKRTSRHNKKTTTTTTTTRQRERAHTHIHPSPPHLPHKRHTPFLLSPLFFPLRVRSTPLTRALEKRNHGGMRILHVHSFRLFQRGLPTGALQSRIRPAFQQNAYDIRIVQRRRDMQRG